MGIKDFQYSLTPSKKRWLSIILILILCFGIGILLLFILIPRISESLQNSPANEVTAVLAIIISIVAIIINLVKDSLRYEYTTKYTIVLSSKVYGHDVIITAVFKNESKNRILLGDFYLFIDKSLQLKNGIYDFYDITKHDANDMDCKLGAKCKNKLSTFPTDIYDEEYKGIEKIFYNLRHLSANSITFIDPGEVFSEDITFNLNPGVYRAILVGKPKNHDCMCSNTQFIVKTNDTENKVGEST
jgi:uncharacterized protein YciU (UPF0263 family)